MAESDIITAFKTFARASLLEALRQSANGTIAKETTYARIREVWQAQGRWSPELDEVEAGPAPRPRWLNRLHWVVAELVQDGWIEPSSGSDELRLTELGHDLQHLSAPFTDVPTLRELIRALEETSPDQARNAEVDDVLRRFRGRFPPERLEQLDLQDYPLGTGNRESFCWWLERGLEENGKYSVGSSRSHLIYRTKDGDWYRVQKLQTLTPEEAMAHVAAWHASVVKVGDSDEPERLDREPGEFVAPARALKLLNSYFPTRFLPVNSPEHLGTFLEGFGVPAAAVPEGAVARNRLLFRLYEALGRPRGLTPLDFMHLLYARFDPRPVKLDPQRLRGAIRLFGLYYGAPGCRAPRFLEQERNYKLQVVERWQELATIEQLERALAEGAELETAAALRQVLIGQDRDARHNLLSFRYHDVLRTNDRPAARPLVEALLELLRSGEGDDAIPNVGSFNQRLAGAYERIAEAGRPAASRSIPTLVLMLSFPERDVFVRSDLFNRAQQALANRPAFEVSGEPMSTSEYRRQREFAEAVRDAITALEPTDMLDVQGFLWGIFSEPRLWFGGITYGGHDDMLQRFRERGVYAVGHGGEEVAAVFAGIDTLTQPERQERLAALDGLVEKGAARDALRAFGELAGAPGSLLLAKASFFHTALRKSVLRLRGLAVTGKPVGYDVELGQMVAAEWCSDATLDLDAGKSLAKLSGTLAAIELAEALTILGAEEASPADAEAAQIDSPVIDPPNVAAPPQPKLQKNLILYGPPGTGKTWQVIHNIAPTFGGLGGDRVSVITFHPGFSYEEFVEGLRPVQEAESSGPVRFAVLPGIFRTICAQAAAAPELPHLLVIDEINRANLAAVLGELITLIETDKRGRIATLLPYSKERFTVPENLWIVGTMNTADRSIALLDTALRRRFAFREIGIDYEALREATAKAGDAELEGLDLAAILEAINRRLRVLVGREHQIGHAWLMGAADLPELAEVFAHRVIPLLAEYFFDDWGKVCLVLGEDPERSTATDLIRKEVVTAAEHRRLFQRSTPGGDRVVLYDLGDPIEWTAEHFRKIAIALPGEGQEVAV